jgi:hypothetical protein
VAPFYSLEQLTDSRISAILPNKNPSFSKDSFQGPQTNLAVWQAEKRAYEFLHSGVYLSNRDNGT